MRRSWIRTACMAGCALLWVLCGAGAQAQETWEKTFGGAEGDYGAALLQAGDGGYVLLGTTLSAGAGGRDITLIKTDGNGNEVWTKTYGGAGDERASWVEATSDGGYVLAGSTFSTGAGKRDAYLVKTDASGNQTWAKTFGGTENDGAACVVQTADGGYALVGFTESSGAGGKDVYLVKTDKDGKQLWARTFGGTGADTGACIRRISDGFILAGTTTSSGAGGKDMYLVKTDASGTALWTKTFGGVDTDEGRGVIQTADGGYALVGKTNASGAGGYDVYLVKADASGNRLWSKTFGGAGDEAGYSVRGTSGGGFLIGGSSCDAGAATANLFLLETDAVGAEVMSRRFGAGGWEEGAAAIEDKDGAFLVAGSTTSSGEGEADIYLVSYVESWDSAYQRMLVEEEDLSTLRAFRERVVLQDPEGAALVQGLYDHAREILFLLISGRDLLRQAAGLIAGSVGPVRTALQGGVGRVEAAPILAFLDALSGRASNGLAAWVAEVEAAILEHRAEGVPFLGILFY